MKDKETGEEELVMYCQYCGAEVPFDQCSCPKCGMILN